MRTSISLVPVAQRVRHAALSNRIRHIDRAHRRRFDVHLHVDVSPVSGRARILGSHARALGAADKWCKRTARVEGIGTALMTRTTKVASAVLQSHSHAKPEVVLKGLFGALLNAMGMQAQVSRSGHPTIDYGQTYVYQLVLRLG